MCFVYFSFNDFISDTSNAKNVISIKDPRTNTAEIHNGDRTHTQDQSITSVSFSTINIISNGVEIL